MPSFALHGFLTVATADGVECESGQLPGWRRALLRSDDGEELVSHNVPKTVEPHLAAIRLLVASNVTTKDGIGYELLWHSAALRGAMQFDNPQSEMLRALEISCLNLADSLTNQSDDHNMFKFVKEWKRYVRQRG